jgi:hypothetical protein
MNENDPVDNAVTEIVIVVAPAGATLALGTTEIATLQFILALINWGAIIQSVLSPILEMV